MKISNELLSAVLGCECEFQGTTTTNIQFRIKNNTIPKDVYLYIVQSSCSPQLNINLDTFIRIAKNGYETYSQERDLLILEDALNNKTLECCK